MLFERTFVLSTPGKFKAKLKLQPEIAHGDVKPNNILVYVEDSDLCYKLTDFDGFQADGFDNEVHTTKEYSPPEFVLAEKYTLKSDIWSLACTFIELRTGICLFDDDQDYSDDDESSICDDEEHPGSFVYNNRCFIPGFRGHGVKFDYF